MAVFQAFKQQMDVRAWVIHDSPKKFIQSRLQFVDNNVLDLIRPTTMPGHLKYGQRHFTDDAVELALSMNLRAMGQLTKKTSETVAPLGQLRVIASTMDPPCGVERLRWMLRVCITRKNLKYQYEHKKSMRRLKRKTGSRKKVKKDKHIKKEVKEEKETEPTLTENGQPGDCQYTLLKNSIIGPRNTMAPHVHPPAPANNDPDAPDEKNPTAHVKKDPVTPVKKEPATSPTSTTKWPRGVIKTGMYTYM
jgi:hypothetical protein